MKRIVTKKFLPLFLSVCMIFSVLSTTFMVTAEGSTSKPLFEGEEINYVSLGASNTNGYGHIGYLPSEVSEDPLAASKADMNVYGYGKAPDAAYPAQIAAALEAAFGKEVNLSQLAISSMRTEELRILLDDEYYGDAYTEWRFTGGQKWFEIALPGGMDALRDAYQSAVKEADLITVDIGWNNFGVYAFNNIKTILADGNFWKAPDFDDVLAEDAQINYENLKKVALNYLESNVGMADTGLQSKLEMIADTLAYATIGACYHFDVVMEKIYELNPDATVVSINIQNLADGLVINFEGMEIDLGELYGKLIEMTDLYRATTCPYADKYLYADAGDVTTFFDEIVAWDGDPATLTRDMKDCFDMYDDGLYVRSIVEYMMIGQAFSQIFANFRAQAAELGLGDLGIKVPFTNDDSYTYEFTLSRAPEELLSLDLSKLDLNNPGGEDQDVEEYGAAVKEHLKNLRGEGNFDAYDYVFEKLLSDLNAVIANQGLDKAVLSAQKTDLEAALEAYPEDPTYTELLRQVEGGLMLFYAVETVIPEAKETFDLALKGLYATYHNTLNYAYDVVATICQYAASIEALEINADTLSGFNSAANAMMSLVANDFINGSMAKFYNELYKNGLSSEAAPEVPEYELNESIITPAVRAIAVLAVRYELGNSFFAHPNTVGHDQITDAVFTALETGLTAKEYSDTVILAAWDWLMEYAEENYPEAYEVFAQVADYIGSEEFAILAAELEALYIKLDAATTPEQKERLANEAYKLIETLQELAAKATHKELTPTYYVSIGDSTLSGYGLDKYVPGMNDGEGQVLGDEAPVLLAKKLFGDDYEAHFKKLDKGGLRTNDILVWLGLEEEFADDYYYNYVMNNTSKTTEDWQNEYQSEIEKADLITLTLGGGDISTYVERQIQALERGDEPYEMDWTRYFPEAELDEVYAKIESAQQLLAGTLPDIMGLPAEIITPVVAEAFLYGIVGYLNNHSKVVDRIHELNPDAQIVIVSYFNSVDGMMYPVSIGGETIELPVGTMLGMLVEISNSSSLAYALANNDYAIFASIADATTILDEQGKFDFESQLNGLINETWLTHAGPAGHEYIRDQIYDAITNDYTAEELSTEAIFALLDFIEYTVYEFGDDVYRYAYNEALEAGYIDAAVDAIDETVAILEAIDLSDAEMTDELKAELEVEIEEIIDVLLAAKALILEADDLDDASLEALLALLDEADEAMQAVLSALEQAGEDVYELVIIPAIDEALYELENTVIPAAKEMAKEIAEAVYDYVVYELYPELTDAIVEAVKKYAPEIADAVYDYLYNNADEVIAFFEEYGDEILELFAEYGEEAAAVIGYVLCNYGEDIAALIIENHEELLDALVWFVEEHGENALELIEVYADALGITDFIENTLEAIEEELNEKLAELEAELEELKAKLEAAAEDAKPEIEAAIAEIEAAIEAIKAELAEIAEELEAIVNAIDGVEDAILDLIDAFKEASEELVEAAIADLVAALEELKEVTEAADGLIDAVIAGLEVLDEIAAVIEEAFAELDSALAELDAELQAKVEELKAELEAFIEDEIIPELEALKTQIETTVQEYITLAETYYELTKFAVELMYYMATNPTYNITEDSLYVAFGDSTAASTSYVDLIAAFLGIPYANVSLDGLNYSDLLEYLPSLEPEALAVIADADLITLGFSPSFGIVDALNEFIDEEEYDYTEAWIELLGEEAAEIVNAYFATLEAELVNIDLQEMIGIEDAEGALVSAIQGYVYGVISDMIAMPEVVSLLRELSPEATIIVLNMYNPLKDVVIDLGSVQVPLGDITDAVVALSGIEGLAYAMLSSNCNFINITNVEIGLEDTTLDIFDVINEFVLNGAESLKPTMQGHFEIVSQIFDQMEVIFDYPLGDVDMDWDVDHVDAMLTLQYYSGTITEDAINLDLADVNGDGEINHVDAMLILQLYSGVITEFPYVEPDIDIEFDSDEELAA